MSTATSNTYIDENGDMRLEAFAESVNYWAESQEWLPIDNELVPAPGAAYEAVNSANSFQAKIPADPSTTPVRFETEDVWVTMRLHGLSEAPEVSGAAATFDEVRGADAVTYEVTSNYLKENILLEEAPVGPLRYTYTIGTSAGLTPHLNADGSIEFRKANGDVTVVMPAAYMFDSGEDVSVSTQVSYELVRNGAGWMLAVTPDAGWLQDPARVYPVTIDPSLGNEPAAKDCWIRDSTPSGNNCGDAATYVKVGRSSGPINYRGLLDFDTSSIPANATVSSAEVPLYLDHTQSASAVTGEYALFRAGLAFSGSSATWSNSGTSGAWDGGDPGATAYGTLSMNGSASGFRIFGGNLKDLVQSWVTNPGNKTGLVLKQAGTSTLNVLSFYSSAPAASNDNKRPRLNVTYSVPNNAPATPTGAFASPGTPQSAHSTTPTLGASVSDPDGQMLTAKFTVLKDGVSVATLWDYSVPSGTVADALVPSGVLNLSVTYEVFVSAFDGALWSPEARMAMLVTTAATDDTLIDPGTAGDSVIAEEFDSSLPGYSDPDGSGQWRSYVTAPDGSKTYFSSDSTTNVEGRGSTWWDAQCPGDSGSDKYRHLKEYPRKSLHTRMVGSDAIHYCGMANRDGSEAAFGLRYIRAGHKSQFAKLAAWEGRDWGSFMNWWVWHTVSEPDAVFEQNEARFCYERMVSFVNPAGNITPRVMVVILGKTARRIMTAWPRSNASYYCTGNQLD